MPVMRKRKNDYDELERAEERCNPFPAQYAKKEEKGADRMIARKEKSRTDKQDNDDKIEDGRG